MREQLRELTCRHAIQGSAIVVDDVHFAVLVLTKRIDAEARLCLLRHSPAVRAGLSKSREPPGTKDTKMIPARLGVLCSAAVDTSYGGPAVSAEGDVVG